jgi:hypothetical protein
MSHWKIAINTILSVAVAFLIGYGITVHNENKMLSERLEMANNNVEAYQDALKGAWWASNVLKLDMDRLSEQNDSLIKEIDRVRKENKIKPKDLTVAATQTQIIDVKDSKGVRGDIIEVLKDTTYTDTLMYNPLTAVYYSIGKDSVSIQLDVKNTQYLYIFKHKEYKNKKNLLKRLLTFDWKKITKYKYLIENTNELVDTKDVRIIESVDK